MQLFKNIHEYQDSWYLAYEQKIINFRGKFDHWCTVLRRKGLSAMLGAVLPSRPDKGRVGWVWGTLHRRGRSTTTLPQGCKIIWTKQVLWLLLLRVSRKKLSSRKLKAESFLIIFFMEKLGQYWMHSYCVFWSRIKYLFIKDYIYLFMFWSMNSYLSLVLWRWHLGGPKTSCY